MNPIVKALRQQLQQLQAQFEAGELSTEAHAAARATIERRILDAVVQAPADTAAPAAPPPPRRINVRWLVGIALAGALLLGLAHWLSGPPESAVEPAAVAGAAQPAAQTAAQSPHALGKGEMEAMTARLAERLKGQPDDVTGWVMLGRSYLVIGNPALAVPAYERALKLKPADAGIMADYAEALAARSGSFEGEPVQWIDKALKADPDNLKALALAGRAAFDRGDFALAAKHYDRAVKLGPADTLIVRQAAEGARAARERGKLPAATK